MKNVKFDMLRKVFSHFFSKQMFGLSKAIGGFCAPPYLVMGNLSVSSISLEVLETGNEGPDSKKEQCQHYIWVLKRNQRVFQLEKLGKVLLHLREETIH